MRKPCTILLFASFYITLLMISNPVLARSWVKIEPEEVLDRAEVIIIGKYDFTSEPKPGESVFQGLDFNVKNMYKGEIHAQTIIAGLDYNDVGWAEDFQNEGGEFLLFLENSEYADFLVPVGGPNGMIEIQNGKVEDFDNERQLFFEDFLKSQPEKSDTANNSQSDESNLYLYVSGSVLVAIATIFLFYRYKRKRGRLVQEER